MHKHINQSINQPMNQSIKSINQQTKIKEWNKIPKTYQRINNNTSI